MLASLYNKVAFMQQLHMYLQLLQTATNKTICVSEPDNFSET